ncbi:hypothetical protein HPB48_004159 [Haemaphysalis longicornis]|uniref:Uncharacterized protein n=1 Tax=Haemaphysalis longicornis TaxID=44386 RepID=A0A9J6GL00_HAELO|nr:hypothetical protein HPB48_004159 [Haemaphysalis longicornis]
MIAQALPKVLHQDRLTLETRVQAVSGEEAPRGRCQEPIICVENPGPHYSSTAELSNLPGIALGLRVNPTNKVPVCTPSATVGGAREKEAEKDGLHFRATLSYPLHCSLQIRHRCRQSAPGYAHRTRVWDKGVDSGRQVLQGGEDILDIAPP